MFLILFVSVHDNHVIRTIRVRLFTSATLTLGSVSLLFQ